MSGYQIRLTLWKELFSCEPIIAVIVVNDHLPVWIIQMAILEELGVRNLSEKEISPVD
jgi:hypothetical protein